MFDPVDVLTQTLATQEGRVVGFTPEGQVLVETEGSEALVPCAWLRTSQAPPPRLEAGMRVLAAVDAPRERGYLLGVITLCAAPQEDTALPEAPVRAEEHVEIKMPGRVDTIRLNGKRIHLEADDEIVLQCGQSTLSMNRLGKVVVRGNNIVSRARQMNKIKGAGVAIN